MAIYPLICSTFNRQGNAQGEYAVFRREKANATVLFGNGEDALATIAVACAFADGQVILNDDFTGVGIFDFDEQVVLAYATVKFYPLFGGIQFGHGVQCVFQAVGEDGAKLGIGNGKL